MRIDLYGAAEVSAERAGTGISAGVQTSPATVPEDTATLSSGSLSVPSLAEQALKLAEQRYAKVDALNRAVNSGAYTLDPAIIAHAITTSEI
jgi:anti-sigma28 factor (negative regulator of flagellin synthesis)